MELFIGGFGDRVITDRLPGFGSGKRPKPGFLDDLGRPVTRVGRAG
ncbi:hypothetical protein [Streptomyces sp. NBC_00996]|nr:hypothetical protein OG390_28965 [Streptomyces sp. NBC_00996]